MILLYIFSIICIYDANKYLFISSTVEKLLFTDIEDFGES